MLGRVYSTYARYFFSKGVQTPLKPRPGLHVGWTNARKTMTKKKKGSPNAAQVLMSPRSTFIRDWCLSHIEKVKASKAAKICTDIPTPPPPPKPIITKTKRKRTTASELRVVKKPRSKTPKQKNKKDEHKSLCICPKCNYALPDNKKNFPYASSPLKLCVICIDGKGLATSSFSPDSAASSPGDTKQNAFRTCKSCKMTLPLQQNFEINSTSMRGTVFRKWKCKVCRKIEQKQLAIIKKSINMDDYYGKPCCICLRTMTKSGSMRATPDHCHEKGTLRSVICNDCNTSIGKLGDSVAIVRRALSYLEKYQ